MNAKIEQLKDYHARVTAAIEQLGIVQSNLREELADEYIAASGKTVHASNCSTSCAPAELPDECDCVLHAQLLEYNARFVAWLRNELNAPAPSVAHRPAG